MFPFLLGDMQHLFLFTLLGSWLCQWEQTRHYGKSKGRKHQGAVLLVFLQHAPPPPPESIMFSGSKFPGRCQPKKDPGLASDRAFLPLSPAWWNAFLNEIQALWCLMQFCSVCKMEMFRPASGWGLGQGQYCSSSTYSSWPNVCLLLNANPPQAVGRLMRLHHVNSCKKCFRVNLFYNFNIVPF